MDNGNFSRMQLVNGDGEEQQQMEELLELLHKATLTDPIVTIMPEDMAIQDIN